MSSWRSSTCAWATSTGRLFFFGSTIVGGASSSNDTRVRIPRGLTSTRPRTRSPALRLIWRGGGAARESRATTPPHRRHQQAAFAGLAAAPAPGASAPPSGSRIGLDRSVLARLRRAMNSANPQQSSPLRLAKEGCRPMPVCLAAAGSAAMSLRAAPLFVPSSSPQVRDLLALRRRVAWARSSRRIG